MCAAMDRLEGDVQSQETLIQSMIADLRRKVACIPNSQTTLSKHKGEIDLHESQRLPGNSLGREQSHEVDFAQCLPCSELCGAADRY
jgi:hypothetical protein